MHHRLAYKRYSLVTRCDPPYDCGIGYPSGAAVVIMVKRGIKRHAGGAITYHGDVAGTVRACVHIHQSKFISLTCPISSNA